MGGGDARSSGTERDDLIRTGAGASTIPPSSAGISDLRLALGPAAREQLTLPHFLEDVVHRFGPRIAFRFEGRDTTFAELGRQTRAVARALVDQGIEPGERVALLLANRPEWAMAAFAVSQVGGVVVPVSTFSTPSEREYILRHCDASMLLMQRGLAGRDFVQELLSAHEELRHAREERLSLESLPDLRAIVSLGLDEGTTGGIDAWESFAQELRAESDSVVAARIEAVQPDHSGLLIYTSGTTDRPKGVLHAQKAAVIQSWRFAEMLGLSSDDIVLTAQPFFWTAGISMSLGATMAAGAKLLMQETFAPDAALDCLERERATTLHAWVHQEKAMAEHPSAKGRDLSCLHRIEFGSPLAPLAGLEEDVWGIHASYGMTETFTLASALPTSATAAQRTGNSGIPLPGMEIRIVDPESGEARRPEESGEIVVRGATLMQGYWKVPRENVLDPDGFFHTGDSGSLDDAGRLHWEGRLSGMIKTGGANVSPLEVERVAADHPGVRVAIAVGVPHPTLGEALVLCVVPTEGNLIDEPALRRRMRERLAAYKIPRAILVVDEAEAPTTGTQKLRADALRSLALERLNQERIEIAGHAFGSESSE